MKELEKLRSRLKEKLKPTPGSVLSVVGLLIILLVLYLPTITSVVSSFAQPEKLGCPLVPYTYSYARDDLYKYCVKRMGVPGYDVEIYLSFETESVEFGETVRFHVEIDDVDGRLEKPYFYIFLVNNTGHIGSVFPAETSLNASYKLSQWLLQNGCLRWPIEDGGPLIPRQTLTDGRGDCWENDVRKDDCEIWFERKVIDHPSQIGRWEVYVLVFEEEYYTLGGEEEPSENAITYTMAFFQVTSKKRPEQFGGFEVFSWFGWLSRIFATIVSTYGMFRKISPWINAHSEQILGWWGRNKRIDIITIIALVSNLILFLLEK
jgi:hypothetical protein